ncbi:MAG TPA: VOC family protein [Kofleriaceae bacterium]|jgi:predicted 3-demethylubiquinone-9 3-methyltransferase (glyoxalase superfamily)|nr:VOC family protein [Kofleriaceae bacterium]
MPAITTFLTFDNQAEAAVRHYLSIFEGKVVSTMPGPDDTVMGLTFEMLGQTFIALNGGPSFTFTPGISLFVSVETQAEIDRYWTRLIADGGKEVQCGWLVDKFGVSWQIVPTILPRLFSDKDREKAGRAVQAMLGMQKLDIAGLQKAFDGR